MKLKSRGHEKLKKKKTHAVVPNAMVVEQDPVCFVRFDGDGARCLGQELLRPAVARVRGQLAQPSQANRPHRVVLMVVVWNIQQTSLPEKKRS